ncbi:unnamed protein product [Oppiella nova]|uniref:Ribonuclease H2 subunit A n=1 Tax=Oppiella nova TaxID=334625 RepID=A0A7R9QHV5_9ACAR|nr:unnamed protein product [Oppiella nova]CAG2165670.1 unnamed protein product [Oppiella nova]
MVPDIRVVSLHEHLFTPLVILTNISDPKTKSFLSKNLDPTFGYTTFVRFSWSTIKNILDDKAIDCQWEESEDEEPVVESKPTKKISNYFRAVNREEKPQKTRLNAFLKERNLEPITSPQDL